MPNTQSSYSKKVFFPAFLMILMILAIPKPGIDEPGPTDSMYDLAPEIHVLNSGSTLTQKILMRDSPSLTML